VNRRGQSVASAECVFDVFRGIVRLIQGMLPASCGLGMITGFPQRPTVLQGETGMKLYYHPVSTTSRPVWPVHRRERHQVRIARDRPHEGGALPAGVCGDQPEPHGTRAGGRGFPLDESSAISQVPRGENGLFGLSEGAAFPGEGERDDGLDQYAGLSRIRYGLVYPQIFRTTRGAATRRTRARSPGQGKGPGLAENPR